MLIQRTDLHKLPPGQSCPWPWVICCLPLPWGMLSTWHSISDLLVYCGVWALQARRFHKGIWCWAPVILWWITGMTLTETKDGSESGGYSRPFFFSCCWNPFVFTLKFNLGASPQVIDLLAAMIWSWLWVLEVVHRSPVQRGLLSPRLNCTLGYMQTHARKCGWLPHCLLITLLENGWGKILLSILTAGFQWVIKVI